MKILHSLHITCQKYYMLRSMFLFGVYGAGASSKHGYCRWNKLSNACNNGPCWVGGKATGPVCISNEICHGAIQACLFMGSCVNNLWRSTPLREWQVERTKQCLIYSVNSMWYYIYIVYVQIDIGACIFLRISFYSTKYMWSLELEFL